MEAPKPSVKTAVVEPSQPTTLLSTLPIMQLANVVSNAEEVEDEFADGDDEVMAEITTGSSVVPSQPQSTPAGLLRSAPPLLQSNTECPRQPKSLTITSPERPNPKNR
jgi:hypothetical protein